MQSQGEIQPFLGAVFTTALNLGSQFATKKLKLNDTKQTKELNNFQNQLLQLQLARTRQQQPVRPVSTSEGGFSFGLDNTTLLLVASVVILFFVLK